MDRLSNNDSRVAQLLRKARLRLWWIESQRRLQTASFLALGVAALVAAVHGFWRTLPPGAGAIAAAVPLLTAILASLTRRPTPARTAIWADRTLSGASYFSTYEERVFAAASGQQTRAVAALRERAAAACETAERALAGVRVPGVARLLILLGSTVLLALTTRLDLDRDQASAVDAVASAPLADTATRQVEETRRELRASLQSTTVASAATQDVGNFSARTIDDPNEKNETSTRVARPGTGRVATSASADTGTQASGAGATGASSASVDAANAVDLRAVFRQIASDAQPTAAGLESDSRAAFDALGKQLVDSNYDQTLAILSRRVPPASPALAPATMDVSLAAAQLRDRYQADKDNNR